MTSPSFNPYHEWLGIDPSISAPDHYQLIGLPRDEQNPETISRAADAAMSRVRQVRPGDKSHDWARVLDELREAKSCLTNQGRRADYDRQLPPASRPEPAAMAPSYGSSPASGPAPMAGYTTPMPQNAPYNANQHTGNQYTGNQHTGNQYIGSNAMPMSSPGTGQPMAMAGYAGAGYAAPAGFSPAPFAHPNNASAVPAPQQATPVWGQMPYGRAGAPQAPVASAVPMAYAPMQGTPTPGMPTAGMPVPGVPMAGYPSPAMPLASPTPTPSSAYSPASSPSPSSTGTFDPMAPFDPTQMDKPAGGPAASVATAVAAAQTGLPMGKTVSPASPPTGAAVSANTSVGKVARKRANQGRHLPIVFSLAALMVLVTAAVLYSVLGNPKDDNQVAQGQPSNNGPSIPAAAPAAVNRSAPQPASNTTRPTPTSVSISSDDEANPSDASGEDGPKGSSATSNAPSKPSPIGPVNSDDPFEVGDPDVIDGSGTDANPAMMKPTDPDAAGSPDSPPTSPSPTPDPTPAPTPTPEPNTTPAPAPMPAPAEMPTMQEVQALVKALTTAREALGEMNLDIADAELAKAQPLAKLPAHQAKLDRLKQLTHYTRQFRHALEESLKGLQAGQSIPISESTVVAVVEANANTLIIKVAGVTRRYPVNELPLGLAVALADMWLDQGQPSSQLVKGAFVVAHKKASADNIAKARGWWEEAAARGLTLVNDLMPVIEDRYDNLADDLK